MRFFGLDLAWGDRNSSGVCVADGDGVVIDERLIHADDEIVGWVHHHLDGAAVIAADIPLTVPNPTGSRPCDRAVQSAYGSRKAGPHPANRNLFLSRFGMIRGEDLAIRFAGLGFAGPWEGGERILFEAYPHPTLIEVFGLDERLAYKKGTVAERRKGLIELRSLLARLETAMPRLVAPHVAIPRTAPGSALKDIEDLLDARICAWIAMAWAAGRTRTFGDAGSGHIVVGLRPDQW